MPSAALPYSRLRPTNDFVFKALFRDDEALLIGLLTAVLQPLVPIVGATVMNPELPKSSLDDKGVLLDIKVRLSDGRHVNVEMQTANESALEERLLYYWARVYGSQLQAGESYEDLAPCYGVYFFDFELPGSEWFHGHYLLREQRSGRLFSRGLELHTIELPRLAAEARLTIGSAGEALLGRWSRYLSATDPDEIEQLSMSDPLIRKAEDKLRQLSSDDEIRRMAEDRERDRLAYRAQLAASRREGREEGREEGRARERAMVAKLMRLKFGELPNEVAKRVAAATTDELELWAERVLSATSLDEVLG